MLLGIIKQRGVSRGMPLCGQGCACMLLQLLLLLLPDTFLHCSGLYVSCSAFCTAAARLHVLSLNVLLLLTPNSLPKVTFTAPNDSQGTHSVLQQSRLLHYLPLENLTCPMTCGWSGLACH
jgi:hypothetical protein